MTHMTYMTYLTHLTYMTYMTYLTSIEKGHSDLDSRNDPQGLLAS